MSDEQYEILDASLNVMVKGPAPLAFALSSAPLLAGIEGDLSADQLLERLRVAAPDDPVRNRLRTSLVAWDYDETGDWRQGTRRNTRLRRDLIYTLLQIDSEFADLLDESLPFARLDAPIVVSEEFRPWYTTSVQRARNFYWRAYESYLRTVRNFDPDNVEKLNDAAITVMERLTNPQQEPVYQSKGLVVGYVQSGKTANFTGVIAKAIDAGYRLVIVLSGTMDLLRDQTQRRIDMELVGKEQIRRDVTGEDEELFDYHDDPDWEKQFISHGGRPSEMGAFDIIRLTGAGQVKGSIGDYQSLKHGIQTLEIEKIDKQRPLFDPVNLHAAAARLMVVKKNASRLQRLVRDLKKIGIKALSEVPVLIIDDESDQASVNTIRPNQKFLENERRRRSTINQRVTELLEILPRAQYVGYTATPFANVFVDPEDASDIFPKDFIVSLPKPEGYMGARDFHDFDSAVEVEDRAPSSSNEAAFVRSIWDPHEESTEQLQRAIDTFVLTGAIKLYRERHGTQGDFRHHTMLVHESQRQRDHELLQKLMEDLWSGAGYDGGGGLARLEKLLREDIIPVSGARGHSVPTPSGIDELRSDLGETVRLIEDGGRPVLLVNGTKEADTPNFDKIPVWKIIVGGAKLSRGYTIEGLTVSYFRRRATYQDTLMQMGRWFGFRPGYRDLVRLFIGRHEPLTAARKRFIDLYEAFGTICRDEDAFRAQLKMYAMPADGSRPLTPKQVPPLVMNSHPQLVPAAKNKMFNAVLKSKNFGADWVERTLCSDADYDLRHNEELFTEALRESDARRSDFVITVGGSRMFMDAYWTLLSHSKAFELLSSYRWAPPHTSSLLKLELDFFSGKSLGDPEIDDWILLLPQLKTSQRMPWQAAGNTFTTVQRSRVDGFGRFKAFTDPTHRHVAQVLTGKTSGVPMNEVVEELTRPRRRGAILLYPVYPPPDEETDQSETPAMGFALLPPANDLPRQIQFGVRVRSLEEDPVVEAADVASQVAADDTLLLGIAGLQQPSALEAVPATSLAETVIRNAFPFEPPPRDLLSRDVLQAADESSSRPDLRRAYLWAAALASESDRSAIGRRVEGYQFETYGFVSTPRHGTSLALILYVTPDAADSASVPESIEVGGHEFLVVVRPANVTDHSLEMPVLASSACRISLGRSSGRRGFLTAAHAVAKDGRRDNVRLLQIGDMIETVDSDGVRQLREVVQFDLIMDAAIVGSASGDWTDGCRHRISTVVGYKSVSLMSRYTNTPPKNLGNIVEIMMPRGQVVGQPGGTPPYPSLLFSSMYGVPGDSGGLVMDLETNHPYAMYLGTQDFDTGRLGRCLMLAQPQLVWEAEFYQ